MPRPNPGPRLRLYGPDNRYGATPRKGFTSYLWYIIWSEKGKKRERSTGRDRQDRGSADQALSEFLAKRLTAWKGTRRPDDIRVLDVLALYAKERAINITDAARAGYAIKRLSEWWGDHCLADVAANTCRAYARERLAAAGTVRRELGVLRTAIRYAWREGKLTHEVPVVVPDRPSPRDLWLTRDEAALLLRGARAGNARLHLPHFIFLGLYSGHRKRAILDLQWQPNTVGGHVDMLHGIIDFRRRGPQTRKRRARIPIPRRVATFLPYLRKRTRQYVLEWHDQRIGNIKKAFNGACRRAAWLAIKRGRGLPKSHAKRRELAQSARKLRAATPHTLRHTCVTWLVAKGVPFADIGAWVGMTAAMVERVYGHHSPAQHQRVRAVEGRR